MRKFFRGRIGAKVGAWFILIAVIPLASVTILTQKNIRTVIISDITAHLKDIIHEKIERIDLYVEEQQQSLGILANTPTVVNVFTQLQISQQGEGQKISGVVAEVDDEAGQFFQKALLQTGYYDIFLITLDGDIVYTLAEEEDLGTNLYTGPYRDSGLALVFSKAVSLLDSEISSFSYYPPSRKPAAFVATPVFGNGQLLGVIAAQLNEERLFYIFTDYLGLGESGELLAGRLREDGSLVAAGPLRHRPDALRDEFVLSGKTTLPIQLAVMGKKGAGLTHDYRGKPIIAAWDYVPSMDWGVVIKIDRDEAFAPIYRQTLIIAGVGLATLVLVLCGIFFATSSIIGPVKQLALVVQHFANGDFKARARKMRDDEVGILTDHFNDMADTIEQYTFTMEEEVAHRTQELAQAKDSLDRAQEIAHVGSWEWNITTGKLAWSDEIYRIFGLEPQEFVATYEAFLEAIHPDDRDSVTKAVERTLAEDKPYSVSHRVVLPDGTIRMVQESGDVQRDDEGGALFMFGTVQDVTEIRAVQKRLSEYVDIIDENVLTSATDLDGNITYASDAFCRTCGYARDELLGKNHRIVRHPEMPAKVYEELWKTILGGKVWKGTLQNITKDGGSYWVDLTISPTWDDSGRIKGFTAIHNDITDKKRIEEISITDELTGLFNRRRFNDLFPEELLRARRDGKVFTFIMLDVDFFKKYNDTYGHQKGDDVLQRVGAVMKQTVRRPGDYVFRLGGEEFGVCVAVKKEEDGAEIAEKLRMAVEGLHIVHEKNKAAGHVTISCGFVSVGADRGFDYGVDEIYKMADAALYKAKEEGRNRVRGFTE